MFKNAILYKAQLEDQGQDIESCLQAAAFIPCDASQEKSSGWVPPRAAFGALVESISGQRIIKLMTETKTVPASVINRKAAERAAQIEASTGRKPGKKETRNLKDDIRLELLPNAFTKQVATLVWIDTQSGVMLVDASSQTRADDAVTALVSAIPGLSVHLIVTKTSPIASMAEWLLEQEGPAGFSIDRECELKACDESKAVVKYNRHSLDIGEIQNHIRTGKLPTKLAMTWNDRVSFVLTEGLQLKKLAFLDVVFEAANHKNADDFDADIAITTGELSKLIPDLLDALGGEVTP